ncbi:MAG: GNAT family N-acetyltransferase [Deltaproteobacteria bacterium]|nr:MAG: GNAT family N-acetyltransferase [Deltaproteobacteria bacterium]
MEDKVERGELLRKITVRRLKLEDLEAIVEIDHRVLGTRRPSYWRQKIEEMGNEHPSKSLVAELDGKVVGFIMGTVSGWEFGVPNTIGWIDTIGIDPNYQKKGIATLLFKAIMEEFKKEGVENIYTLVKWEDWDLMCFFKAIGFTRGDMINLEYKIK